MSQGPLREATATLEGGAVGVWCVHKNTRIKMNTANYARVLITH